MRLAATPRWSGGHHPVGDATSGPNSALVQSATSRRVPRSHGHLRYGAVASTRVDERLRLDALIERYPTDPRTGHNRQFSVADLFRQSIYSRLAGYEDTNDAARTRRFRCWPRASGGKRA